MAKDLQLLGIHFEVLAPTDQEHLALEGIQPVDAGGQTRHPIPKIARTALQRPCTNRGPLIIFGTGIVAEPQGPPL